MILAFMYTCLPKIKPSLLNSRNRTDTRDYSSPGKIAILFNDNMKISSALLEAYISYQIRYSFEQLLKLMTTTGI